MSTRSTRSHGSPAPPSYSSKTPAANRGRGAISSARGRGRGYVATPSRQITPPGTTLHFGDATGTDAATTEDETAREVPEGLDRQVGNEESQTTSGEPKGITPDMAAFLAHSERQAAKVSETAGIRQKEMVDLLANSMRAQTAESETARKLKQGKDSIASRRLTDTQTNNFIGVLAWLSRSHESETLKEALVDCATTDSKGFGRQIEKFSAVGSTDPDEEEKSRTRRILFNSLVAHAISLGAPSMENGNVLLSTHAIEMVGKLSTTDYFKGVKTRSQLEDAVQMAKHGVEWLYEHLLFSMSDHRPRASKYNEMLVEKARDLNFISMAASEILITTSFNIDLITTIEMLRRSADKHTAEPRAKKGRHESTVPANSYGAYPNSGGWGGHEWSQGGERTQLWPRDYNKKQQGSTSADWAVQDCPEVRDRGWCSRNHCQLNHSTPKSPAGKQPDERRGGKGSDRQGGKGKGSKGGGKGSPRKSGGKGSETDPNYKQQEALNSTPEADKKFPDKPCFPHTAGGCYRIHCNFAHPPAKNGAARAGGKGAPSSGNE